MARRVLARSLALGALVGAGLALAAAPVGAAPALHVIPFPGTPDAAPQSRVIFSALRPSDITAVRVSGSSTGVHSGHVTSLPDGAGAAFVPQKPFKPGERVSVVAELRSAAGGTASGDPGARVLRFSFGVGIAVQWHGFSGDGVLPRSAGASTGPTQSFRSQPGLHPPIVTATSNADRSSGDIFLTPVSGHPESMQAGPMILDSQGRLLWFRPVHAFATNLEVQRYRGLPVLTWWQRGQNVEGEDVIVGRSYRRIAVLRAAYGYLADIHEFQLTPQGTALIDAFVPVQANLTSVGGSAKGWLMDCVIQELDIRTGRVLWEWHALGHVPLKAAFMGTPKSGTPYDFFHLNSIQRLPNGNLLVSARDTWAVYEIDKNTGRVIWTLGGKDSNFRVMPGAGFEWQHDAELHPGGILTVFDDASDTNSQEESQSSAKTIRLNMSTKSASLVAQYTHTPPLVSGAEGSEQLLANKNVFVGWGDQPEFSEYTASGRQIFNGSLPLGITSYRAFRFPWHGQPPGRPAIAVAPVGSGAVKVYASWNGATNVATWRVQGGGSPGSLAPLAHAQRTGFETVVALNRRPRYVEVQALDGQGKVLGTSRARAVGR